MDIIVIFGFILSIVGVIGCIIPGVPGPPLNLISIIFLKIAYPDEISLAAAILFGIMTIAVTLIDYAIPMLGGKLFKASKSGIIGSTVGMIIGIFFFPPFGIFIGLVIGAFVGELVSGKSNREATKTGAGIFALSVFAMLLKLAASLVMSFYFLLKVSQIYNYQFKLF